jgi:hypothetical protein
VVIGPLPATHTGLDKSHCAQLTASARFRILSSGHAILEIADLVVFVVAEQVTARLPVRSALFKQRTGGLVVKWVATNESPLLYVFGVSFLFFFIVWVRVSSVDIV